MTDPTQRFTRAGSRTTPGIAPLTPAWRPGSTRDRMRAHERLRRRGRGLQDEHSTPSGSGRSSPASSSPEDGWCYDETCGEEPSATSVEPLGLQQHVPSCSVRTAHFCASHNAHPLLTLRGGGAHWLYVLLDARQRYYAGASVSTKTSCKTLLLRSLVVSLASV